MEVRRVQLIFSAVVVLLAGLPMAKSIENTLPASMPVVARVHWLGVKGLSRETSAAHFMTIWDLPESVRLEQQTLDKLSLAPWRLLHCSIDANAASRLRPLLDDLMAEESYLEIRQATNQPEELVFAIRLDDRRAALWQTNLAVALESLTGIPPVPAPDHRYGWSLKKHHDPNFLELTRAAGWTILGAAEDHNGLLAELRARIQRDLSPLTTGDRHDWLTADFNPRRLFPALATLNIQHSTFNVHLSVTGDGTNVLMSGTADLSKPLRLDLKRWNIQTNLMDSQLSSLTLVRGIQPWLDSWKTWNSLRFGPPPDQICFWAQKGYPMQSYFTAPLPDASNEVDRVTDWVLQNQTHWFGPDGDARFDRSKTFNGLEWKGVPLVMPFLQSLTVSNRNYVYAGGLPNSTLDPLSEKMLSSGLSRTNLVYHDWEMTGLRTGHWLFMSQFTRLVFHKTSLPADSPGVLWLRAIALKPGNSVTDITQTGPNQLSFTRRSAVGFTGIELNLLADWLESPQFPVGLHSLLTPPSL